MYGEYEGRFYIHFRSIEASLYVNIKLLVCFYAFVCLLNAYFNLFCVHI